MPAGASAGLPTVRWTWRGSTASPRRRSATTSVTGCSHLAQSTYALLPEMMASPVAGERLAAVSALQVIPDVRYVGWLAERLAEKRPFIGYHAMVALLSAARELSDRDFDQVALALTRAKHLASHLPANSDRARTLGFALEELTRRRVTHQAGRS
jgi:hypothetical protein